MTDLADFIQIERQNYADIQNNLFAFSLGQALRYYEFILITFKRYKEASQKMVSTNSILRESIKSQSEGKMSDEQMRLLNQSREQTTVVHLEIESFYLFAKIFLDKISLFLQDYFGSARGIPLQSHDKLSKSHERYRVAKGLIYPSGFIESINFLKEHICDYRDKQISHMQNPRTIRGTMYDASGQTRISTMQIYPTSRDIQVDSKEMHELINAIDSYVQQVIALIDLNRAKTRFKLKQD